MTTYNTAFSNMIDCDGDVIEIIPAEEYDSHRAKIKSSLSWLLSKVYGSHVPKELKDPFYETAQGQLHLRPVMVNLLSSSELYCQACSNMFPETHTQWQGHWSIIQVLSRKGIYISDAQDSAVTETVLVQTAPFRLQAHLALIDALMKAYTYEVASIEKVVKAVRHLTAFQASSELPDTSEDALRFWINKVCTVLATEGWSKGGSEEIIQGSAGQRVRVFGKSVSPRESVQVPLLEDLMRDIGDGCSVAALIAFYRPHFLNIKDLCLKENIGIADSLHNLRQIGRFCQSHLPWKCFHLSYEDLLYTHETMRVNIIAFLADLFYCFEGPGSSQVEGSGLGSAKQPVEKVDAIPPAGKKNVQSMISDVPISLVTKRSFQRQSFEDTANNLGMGRPAISTPNVHQPLLPRRGRRSIPQEEGLLVTGSPPTTRRVGRRTLSLCSPQDRETVHRSVLAWQDDQRVSPRNEDRGSRSGLLANVSIDSEMNQSFNANNSLSLDLSGLDSSGETVVGPGHPDYMELESVSSGQSRHTYSSSQQHSDHRSPRAPYGTQAEQKQEPLTPAFLRPTKERESSLSKAEERGDRLLRRRKLPSPTQQSPASQYNQQLDSANLSTSLSVSSDETTVSSLAPGESQSPRYIQGPTESGQRAWATHSLHEDLDPNRVVSPSGKASTPQAVHTAEFPVSSNIGDVTSVMAPSPAATTADRSREGSISSSGEFSDHESRKIHQEYKVRESGLTATLNHAAVSANNSSMPVMIMSGHLDTTGGSDEGGNFSKSPSSTTSFAELKRLKDRLCFSLDKDPSQKQSPCDLGNVHSAGQPPGIPSPVTDGAVNGLDPPPSELQQLRLKLEQKRKEIERKKHRQETQQNKMRQRLGKAAFMRVVTQHLDGREEDELTELPETRPDHLLTSTQAQLQARLGHSAHKFPVGGSYRSQPQVQLFSPTLAIGHGGQSTVTDWKAQSHLLRGANGDLSNFAGTVPRPGNLTQTSYFNMPGAGTATASCVNSDSSSAGHITGIKAFSREGIQQTIDNVRNRYFKSDTSSVPGTGRNIEEAQVDEVSYRSHGMDQIPGTTSALQDQIPHSSHNQPLSLSASHSGPTRNATPAIPIPSREAVLLSSSCTSLEHPEYDSSLDKLNNSLSELQGEIMRMSLQQDQFKTPCSPGSDGFIPRMIQSTGSVPLSSSYESAHQATVKQGQQPFNDTCSRSFSAMKGDPDLMANAGTLPHSLSGSYHKRNSNAQDQTWQVDDESEPAAFDSPSDGFFVSFDDETTPTQSKPPPMLEQQTRGLPSSHNTGETSVASHGDFMANVNGASSYHDGVTAGQAMVDTHSGQKGEIHLTDSSPKVGFIIKDEASIVRENAIEDEMQKKRIKLLEMQRKRKEEQEKRKTEKEAEVARKHEEKQIKEEEQERKKAEEKARREVIFQQYLQKKQEEDEAPAAKPKPKRRDGSASKPRPKSMFAKSKAMTPEPGALAPDSGSSSQEDLSGRATFGGRATPSIMSISAMRASFHACLPQPSLIRKAVSCNILQGASNVSQSPSPNRRPPSPDLCKLKQLQQQQQRPRGNSQDSGSETGSGSNAGSDYSGPKLFVKPSSRSNRHIIVNAISHCCLAGSVNTDMKNRVLEELSKCDANHFLILFRDAGCQYRGLFIFHPETEEAYKVHGVGPKHIANEMCEKFYKYNSGGKSFSEITSTKHLSVSVDAVVLHGAVWKSGKAVVKR